MVARVRTVAFHGVEVIEVETQVTIASGLPAFTVVGLPDKAVAESRERVRAALGALGLALPPRRITVNLAPADVLKEGSHFDLPIALALLAAMDVLPADELGLYTVLGALSIDGSVTSVAGVSLAARLPGILPPLEPAEALELGMIRSVAGGLRGGELSRERPFRDPHHSASLAALVGGGPRARPGEISLAHQGVLFLDELPEFSRSALEALRQPLETGHISVARANSHVTYPARVQLVAAMNPCRCGYLAAPGRACGRAPRCAQEYQARISGPLLDRIDLHIDVPSVSPADLALPPPAESTAEIAGRFAAARARRSARSKRSPAHPARTNA